MLFFTPLVILLSSLLLAQATPANVTAPTLWKRQDKKCSIMMCVTATAKGSTTEYALSSTGYQSLGWMAMGFGTSMVDSPMVILWTNTDGSITMSQRTAASRTQPVVDSAPVRVAAVSTELSITSGSKPSLVFSIPSNSDTTQNIIYAAGPTNPGSSDPGAKISFHIDYGTLTLALAPDSSSGTETTTAGTSTPTISHEEASSAIPMTKYQKMIVVHGIFSVVGFLLLLPFGSLLARYARTFTPTWFTAHWIVQFGFSGPAIIVGFAFGVGGVNEMQGMHFSDDHKKWGLGIIVLYAIQCLIGALIHFVKPANASRRPPQNYLHAVIGIVTIGLAFSQVANGMNKEWKLTGLEALPTSMNNLWVAWIIIVPVLYTLGLGLLPRQYTQEAASRAKTLNRFSMRTRPEATPVYSDQWR